MVASVDKTLPVIFLDTGKLFGVTQAYREKLTSFLGLENVQVIRPDAVAVARQDPDGYLWSEDPNACCALRKVFPLNRALDGFDAWITGRKSYQTAHRENSDQETVQDGRLVISPLHHWTPDDIEAYFEEHDLPRHPMEQDGYTSVGCFTCTSRVADGEDRRAGRWRGQDKTECGIHFSVAEQPASQP